MSIGINRYSVSGYPAKTETQVIYFITGFLIKKKNK